MDGTKVLLLINKYSGKAKHFEEIEIIVNYITNLGYKVDYLIPNTASEMEEVSYSNSSDYDIYIIYGGDGTFNKVINGVMRSIKKPSVAIIPRGTANDMASILGMKKRLVKTLDLIFKTKPILMDVGKINERYFTYALALGSLTEISYDINREDVQKSGYRAYIKNFFRFANRNKKVEAKIKYDLGEIAKKCTLILLLNGNRVAKFNLMLFSTAKLNDGLLEIAILNYRSFLGILKVMFFFLFFGKTTRKDLNLISTKYEINVDNSFIWNVDGEKGPSGNVYIEVLKESLLVHASHKAIKKYFLKTN